MGAIVKTPAFLPIVSPNIDTISLVRLESKFDTEILITNSYIIKTNDYLREEALDVGLHEVLDFDGAIMTDSGSFQLAKYGEIDTTTGEIPQLQRDISTDIATPVGISTPPDVIREQAEADPEITRQALADVEAADTGEMLVNASMQGSTYPDPREETGRHAGATDLDVLPVSAAVPITNVYCYDDMVDAVVAAKYGLGVDAPVHLLSASHPIILALVVVLSCDLFDSAAYTLCTCDGRYLIVRGTEHLGDLDYLPYTCSICMGYLSDDPHEKGSKRQEQLFAEHNLHTTFAELRHVKQAIRGGDLMELVEERVRSYPAMLDSYRALLARVGQLERKDLASKGVFFYTSSESTHRPEVARYRTRMDCLTVEGHVLLTEGGVPFGDNFDAMWRVVSPFGPLPRPLFETYPLTTEVPGRLDRDAYGQAARDAPRLVEENPGTAFTLAHGNRPESALAHMPESIELGLLSAVSGRLGDEASVGGDGGDDGGLASSVEQCASVGRVRVYRSMLLDSPNVSANTTEAVLWYVFMGTHGGENRMHALKIVEEQSRNTNQLAETLDLDYKTVRHHLDMFVDNDVAQRSGDDCGAVYLLSPRCRANWETVGTVVERMG